MNRQSKSNRPTAFPPQEGYRTFKPETPMYWVVPQAPPASNNLLSTGVNMPRLYSDTQPDFAFTSASSAPTSGTFHTAMNVFMDSLEGTAHAVAVAVTPWFPYISPISNLLRLITNIRDEMDQGDDNWEVVRYRLKKLLPMLNNLGQWCALYKLEERDLPPTLSTIFQALRNELDEVRRDFIESTKVRSTIKKMISRKDIIRKARKCDVKLSDMLQRFQIALAIDARFEQIMANRDSQVRGRSPHHNRVVRLPLP